ESPKRPKRRKKGRQGSSIWKYKEILLTPVAILLCATVGFFRGWIYFWTPLALLVVLLTFLLFRRYVKWVTSDQGKLTIRFNGLKVQAMVVRHGEEIAVIRPEDDDDLLLASGEYDLKLRGNPKNLELKPAKITIQRDLLRVAEVIGEVRQFKG